MRIRALFLITLLTITCVYAEPVQNLEQAQPTPSITQPQNISFKNCTKMFGVDKERLFYLTLSAITANKFIIDEIQTENGYIIFTAAKNKFLATVSGIDSENSILKITPCNNIYIFPPGVIIGMHKYIEMNLNTKIK